MQSFDAVVKQDELSGELFIQIPEAFSTAHDWRKGDKLSYEVSGEGESFKVINVDQQARQSALNTL